MIWKRWQIFLIKKNPFPFFAVTQNSFLLLNLMGVDTNGRERTHSYSVTYLWNSGRDYRISSPANPLISVERMTEFGNLGLRITNDGSGDGRRMPNAAPVINSSFVHFDSSSSKFLYAMCSYGVYVKMSIIVVEYASQCKLSMEIFLFYWFLWMNMN